MSCVSVTIMCPCGGEIRLLLVNRVLVAHCRSCGMRRPAKDAQPNHPRLPQKERASVKALD